MQIDAGLVCDCSLVRSFYDYFETRRLVANCTNIVNMEALTYIQQNYVACSNYATKIEISTDTTQKQNITVGFNTPASSKDSLVTTTLLEQQSSDRISTRFVTDQQLTKVQQSSAFSQQFTTNQLKDTNSEDTQTKGLELKIAVGIVCGFLPVLTLIAVFLCRLYRRYKNADANLRVWRNIFGGKPQIPSRPPRMPLQKIL